MSEINRTPVCRLVGGSTHVKQTKDYNDEDLDTPKIVITVAVPKGTVAAQKMLDLYQACAESGYGVHSKTSPSAVARPDFSWKRVDGDSDVPNLKGKIPSAREEYVGHWIYSFETSWAFGVGDSSNKNMDPAEIKRGDYIIVCYDLVCGKPDSMRPSVYANLRGVQFVREGDALGAQPLSLDQMFGDADPESAANSEPARDLVGEAVGGNVPDPTADDTPPVPDPEPTWVVTELGTKNKCNPEAWQKSNPAWTYDLMEKKGYIKRG